MIGTMLLDDSPAVFAQYSEVNAGTHYPYLQKSIARVVWTERPFMFMSPEISKFHLY